MLHRNCAIPGQELSLWSKHQLNGFLVIWLIAVSAPHSLQCPEAKLAVAIALTVTSSVVVWRLDGLRLHLNQRDLQWGEKRLSYGQFTKERLLKSSEYFARCMRSHRASFEPN